MKGGPVWNRLAAATGIDFVAIGAALMILAEVKDFKDTSEFASASNEVWGVYTLLVGFAAVFFLWFTSIFVARLRQVEEASATSGRLANVVLASGSAFSGALVLSIAVQWAARELGVMDLAHLSTAIIEGPTLAFLIAPYIGAAGLVVFRAGDGVSPPSRIVAQLSLLVAPAFVAIAGIQMFNNYAWIDETGRIVFYVWVLLVSAIGIQRWGAIDEGWRPPVPPAADEPTGPEPLPGPEPEVTASRARGRKPTARKPAPRKKSTTRRKPAPRKR